MARQNCARVHLDGNKLESLPEDLLKITPQLLKFVASHNKLKVIKKALLDNVPRLTHLDLSYNMIETVPNAFQAMPSIGYIILDHNLIKDVEAVSDIGHDERPLANKVSLKYNRLTSSVLTALYRLVDVENLDLEGNSIEDIPENTFTVDSRVGNLTHLNLANNKITRINENGFGKQHGLVELRLSQNRLTADVFKAISTVGNVRPQGLKRLYLDHNPIKDVPIDAFHPDAQNYGAISSLTLLSMGNTSIKGSSIEAFAVLHNLKELYLQNNSIETIPHVHMKNLTDTLLLLELGGNKLFSSSLSGLGQLRKLQTLLLDRNRIADLPDGVFAPLWRLQKLSLSGNSIRAVRAASLKGPGKGMQFLSLSHNSITQIASPAFENLTSIREIYLNNNNLQTLMLPSSLVQLRIVDISQNQLNSFPTGLTTFASIDKLNVSYNSLTGLPSLTIYNPGAVSVVDFSHNRLSSADGVTYQGRIGVLSFAHNTIPSFTPTLLQQVQGLEELDLSGNGLTSIPQIANGNVHIIKTLKLSDNRISSLPVYSAQNPRSVLTRLELRNNELTQLVRGSFKLFRMSLESIDMRNNNLRELPATTFSDLPKLTSLQVKNNVFDCNCQLAWLRRSMTKINVDDETCIQPDIHVRVPIFCFPVNSCPGDNTAPAAIVERCDNFKWVPTTTAPPTTSTISTASTTTISSTTLSTTPSTTPSTTTVSSTTVSTPSTTPVSSSTASTPVSSSTDSAPSTTSSSTVSTTQSSTPESSSKVPTTPTTSSSSITSSTPSTVSTPDKASSVSTATRSSTTVSTTTKSTAGGAQPSQKGEEFPLVAVIAGVAGAVVLIIIITTIIVCNARKSSNGGNIASNGSQKSTLIEMNISEGGTDGPAADQKV